MVLGLFCPLKSLTFPEKGDPALRPNTVANDARKMYGDDSMSGEDLVSCLLLTDIDIRGLLCGLAIHEASRSVGKQVFPAMHTALPIKFDHTCQGK